MSDAKEAADLFQNHRDELGFVNRAQCEEKDLYIHRENGEVVGAALGNHCETKPQTTLYDIAVKEAYRRQGIAEELVSEMMGDSPHNKIVAKCPRDLEANKFYERTGWVLDGVESGKERRLYVWEKYD